VIPIWAKILVVLALVGGAWFAWEAHEKSVYDRGYKAAMDLRDEQDAAALKMSTADALKKEREHNVALATAEARRLQERSDYEKDKSDAVRVARAGNSGMRCPGATVRADAAPPGGTAASRPSEAQDTEFLPDVAGDLLDIAGTVAQDVRDYNSLADEYDKLVTFCNAPSNQSESAK
jgi:cbb3-type cytochrome oxidase subunit 3